jgi:hypothetical protein
MAMQRKTSQDWLSLIEAWKASDLTQKEFCSQHTIAYSGFHYWFKKFREDKSLSSPGSAFIPVKITSPGSTHIPQATIELVMPDGRRVNFHQGVEVEFLRALLS